MLGSISWFPYFGKLPSGGHFDKLLYAKLWQNDQSKVALRASPAGSQVRNCTSALL